MTVKNRLNSISHSFEIIDTIITLFSLCIPIRWYTKKQTHEQQRTKHNIMDLVLANKHLVIFTLFQEFN